MWKGERVDLLPSDKNYLRKAAQNQDMYMPFRELHPSAKRMRSLFASRGQSAMLSETGFRNAVITRFLSYNSPFLLSGSQHFVNTCEDLLDQFGSEADRDESYFVSGRIYGRNVYRHTWNVREVWDSCQFPSSAGRSFKDFWYALHEGVGVDKKCKLRYVGPLLAMQIAGTSSKHMSLSTG